MKFHELTESSGKTKITPSFLAWFGNSKVVDSDGKPMVVYHATPNDFDTFDVYRGGFGAHFGTKDQANKIAGTDSESTQKRMMRNSKYSPRIIPVYLSIQNPFVMPDMESWDYDDVYNELRRRGIYIEYTHRNSDDEMNSEDQQRSIFDALRNRGYDGIVYKNTHEDDKQSMSWIVFDPRQVKSAISSGYNANKAAFTEAVLFEVYNTSSILNDLRKALMSSLEKWVDGYKGALAQTKQELKSKQTRSLKRNFGKFTDKIMKKIDLMYTDFESKQKNALEDWSRSNLVKYLSDPISSVLHKYKTDLGIQIVYLSRVSKTRMAIHHDDMADRIELIIYIKWDEWEKVLKGERLLSNAVNEFSIDLIHEMVHYNQIYYSTKNGSSIFDRGSAFPRKKLDKDTITDVRYKKEIKKALKKRGNVELKDIAYYASNHEIEAYASSTAAEIVDKAQKVGISPMKYLKDHGSQMKDIKNYQFLGKMYPGVYKKFLTKLVHYIHHYDD